MITQDDVVYFIMTDRFFDGDPNNNVNIDKTNPQLRHGGDLFRIKAILILFLISRFAKE